MMSAPARRARSCPPVSTTGWSEAIVTVCDIIRGEHDLNTVALSGGVFQNALLLERTSQRLQMRDSGCSRIRECPPTTAVSLSARLRLPPPETPLANGYERLAASEPLAGFETIVEE